VQLVNELLRATYPDGTRDLLRERQAEVTPEVLDLMDQLAEEAAARTGPGAGVREGSDGPKSPSASGTSGLRRCCWSEMDAEIVTSGTELLLGETVDTNSTYIARALRDIRVNLYFKTSWGTTLSGWRSCSARRWLAPIWSLPRAAWGPTVDDVTREAVTQATGRSLVLYPEWPCGHRGDLCALGSHDRPEQSETGYLPEGSIRS